MVWSTTPMPGAERATTIMRPTAMKIRDAIATTHLIHEQRLDHIESEGKSPAVAAVNRKRVLSSAEKKAVLLMEERELSKQLLKLEEAKRESFTKFRQILAAESKLKKEESKKEALARGALSDARIATGTGKRIDAEGGKRIDSEGGNSGYNRDRPFIFGQQQSYYGRRMQF